MGRFRLLLLLCTLFALALSAPAWATHDTNRFSGMNLLFQMPNATNAVESDMAFWGDRAYSGNYDGFRIFDISNPAQPRLVTDFRCFGPQNDLSVWDTDRDGEADLLITSIDRTLSGPECGATAVAHDDPNGWEGLRFFDISNETAPVQVGAIYQDCGSHTHTGLQKYNRLIVFNSSYPLRPGPTCGPVRGPEAGRDPHHGVVQVVSLPLGDGPGSAAEGARELRELPVNYPGDPAKPCPTEQEPNRQCEANAFYPFSERGLAGDPHDPASGLVEPMRACHDMTVYPALGLVAAACAEQLQLWRLRRSGLPDTRRPLWTYDQHNVDFWHSATFSWDGRVVNAIDESFGEGCPPTTQLPPGNGGQLVESGNMFFLRTGSGRLLSEFREPRPEDDEHAGSEYCSAHLGVAVPSFERRLLVNAWYTGGVDVIDFTDPRSPREVAYYDVNGDNWSAYWYETGRPDRRTGFEVYATDGVHFIGGTDPDARGDGFQVFSTDVRVQRFGFKYLNPQTQVWAIDKKKFFDKRKFFFDKKKFFTKKKFFFDKKKFFEKKDFFFKKFKNFAKKCAAERRWFGDKGFAKKYGTNKNWRNAFGKCVSGKNRWYRHYG